MDEKNTVVVIDDEEHVVNRIVLAFDWEEAGCRVIASFTDSTEALEKLPYLSPDIVVSDIKMPVLDGLGLFERVKPLCPWSRFIFLSGFNEFSLVRKALQLGAAAYCLKPVDDEELSKALLDLGREIEDRKLSIGYIIESVIRQEDSSVLPVLLSELGNAEYLNKPFIAACSIGDISQELTYYARYRKIRYDTDTFFYFIEDSGLVQSPGFRNRMDSLLSSGSIRGFDWTEASLGSSLKEKLKLIFSNAYSFFTGNRITKSLSPSAYLQKLLSHSRRGDIDELLHMIGGYGSEYPEESRNAEEAVRIYNAVMEAIFHSEGVEFSDPVSNPRELASEFGTLDDMMHYLSSQLSSCIAADAGLPITRLRDGVFKDIIRFINENYCEAITLQSISRRFSISPSYLCQVFQREIGMTFTKYVTRLRIAQAGKLLARTTMPIATISEETGFSEYYYFARVFKKTMGLTPSEYRERKMNEAEAGNAVNYSEQNGRK